MVLREKKVSLLLLVRLIKKIKKVMDCYLELLLLLLLLYNLYSTNSTYNTMLTGGVQCVLILSGTGQHILYTFSCIHNPAAFH